MIKYIDDRLGFVDTTLDIAFVMDDFGDLVHVPFSLEASYFQDH